jgi:hypothetical protein
VYGENHRQVVLIRDGIKSIEVEEGEEKGSCRRGKQLVLVKTLSDTIYTGALKTIFIGSLLNILPCFP